MPIPASTAASSYTCHVLDLTDQAMAPLAAMNVLYGDEPFLRRIALKQIINADDERDDAVARVEGDSSTWRDIHDLLRSSTLFSSEPPIIIVDDADSFVSSYRKELEDYVEDPAAGRLILLVKTWLKTTRLHKKLSTTGLLIDCGLPGQRSGSTLRIDRRALVNWFVRRATHVHRLPINARTMEHLIELVGDSPGIIDQELSKLSHFVPIGEPVTVQHIRDVGCGWRTRSTWDLLDAVLDGNASEALSQLHRLMQAGEEPIALFGAFSWSLRRFALATQWSDYQARQSGRRELPAALRAAGFRNDFKAQTPAKAERQLRQLGWHRCHQILRQLLAVDLQLKGTHSKSPDARRLLETLIVQLSSSFRT